MNTQTFTPSITVDIPEAFADELVQTLLETFPEVPPKTIARLLLGAREQVFVIRPIPALHTGKNIGRLELTADTVRIVELIRTALTAN